MTVRLITVMSWIIIVMMWMPESWFSGCTIQDCYWHMCPHVYSKFGEYSWYSFARSSTGLMVKALKNMGEYQSSNAIAYLGVVPGWAFVNGWLHRQSWSDYIAMILSVFAMYMIGGLSEPVGSMPSGSWFWYCTEWCMRLANTTGLTYGGVCFVVFVVGIPLGLIGDSIWGIVKRLKGDSQIEDEGR
jgi:hypothetical protein